MYFEEVSAEESAWAAVAVVEMRRIPTETAKRVFIFCAILFVQPNATRDPQNRLTSD
jgi:hypothetical protein